LRARYPGLPKPLLRASSRLRGSRQTEHHHVHLRVIRNIINLSQQCIADYQGPSFAIVKHINFIGLFARCHAHRHQNPKLLSHVQETPKDAQTSERNGQDLFRSREEDLHHVSLVPLQIPDQSTSTRPILYPPLLDFLDRHERWCARSVPSIIPRLALVHMQRS
jgi:hypothetical protein